MEGGVNQLKILVFDYQTKPSIQDYSFLSAIIKLGRYLH